MKQSSGFFDTVIFMVMILWITMLMVLGLGCAVMLGLLMIGVVAWDKIKSSLAHLGDLVRWLILKGIRSNQRIKQKTQKKVEQMKTFLRTLKPKHGGV